MGGGKRILLYTQSLAGSGHFVRTYEIARALAAGHQVVLVDGGRPIPRPPGTHPFALLPLPRLGRAGRDGALAPLEPGIGLEGVMAERRRILHDAVGRLRPDLVLVEHFPFSNWDFAEEIGSVLDYARAVHSGVRIVCSVRDIGTPPVGYRSAWREPREVLEMLHRRFEAVLVHADPRLVRLEEPIPWVADLRLPFAYTGFVSEKLGSQPVRPGCGEVLVSVGGQSWPALLGHGIEAWALLRGTRAAAGRTLVVFRPLDNLLDAGGGWPAPADGSVRLEPFSPDFLGRLAGADLSLSLAGYNICMNVLETGTRAVLVPHPAIADRRWRARRLEERGLARTLAPEDLTADRLAAVLADALAGPRPVHDLDLNGANTTCRLLEAYLETGELPSGATWPG